MLGWWKITRTCLVVLLFTITTVEVTLAEIQKPPIFVPFENSSSLFVNVSSVDYKTSRHFSLRLHVVRTNNPSWSTVSSYHSPNASGLATTSQLAKQFDCDWIAANAGPFHADGTSCGPLVQNGEIEQTSLISTDWVGFGRTKQEWVLGNYFQIQATHKAHRLQEFVTGFQWLVYNSTIVPTKKDDNPTGATWAARTAIGLDHKDRILLVVAEGCEHCLWHRGLTLNEMAEALVSLGATFAVNMDGGSSSTLVYQNQLVNRPSACLGILPFESCERPVATVHCFRKRLDQSSLQ